MATLPPLPASTLALYGPTVASAVRAVDIVRSAAAAAKPLEDPVGTLGYAVDAGEQLAALLGVGDMDKAGWSQAADIMGSVIKGYVSLLNDRMARKGQQEDKARAEAQLAVLDKAALNADKAGRGYWEVSATLADVGDDAFFTEYRGVGLPGVLSKARSIIFPTDIAAGCFRVEPPAPERGRPAVGSMPWRLWPAMYPFCWNTNDVGGQQAGPLYTEAAGVMADLAARSLDNYTNLAQDARIVAQSFDRFWSWSRPFREGTKGTGVLTYVYTGAPLKHLDDGKPTGVLGDMAAVKPHGAGGRLVDRQRFAAGERDFAYDANGLTITAIGHINDPDNLEQWAGHAGRSWYAKDRTLPIGSCRLDAYNHIVTTFARFFAVRARLMAMRRQWEVDDVDLRAIALASPDPAVRNAMKRPAPPLPRTTTTTRGVGFVPATKKLEPVKPVRVGRGKPARVGRVAGELAAVLDAPNMPELLRRMAAIGGRR